MPVNTLFKQVFIIGAGYVGAKLGRRYIARNIPVQALVRSDAARQRAQEAGMIPVAGDLDDIWGLRRLQLQDTLLYYLAPPPTTGLNDVRMRTFVNAVRAGNEPAKVVLISTTGVYGDCGGQWIDETQSPKPQADRAHRRLDAENVLRAWGRTRGVPVVVLRVAGIYGADRLPLERLRRGEAVLREVECPYSNRIHVEDLVTVCMAAAEKGIDQNIYNVSDGHPGTMTEYFFAVADAVGLPRPPEITLAQAQQQLSSGMLSYLSESRRLRNAKLLTELQVQLRYPDLASGLASLKSGQ